MAKTFKDYRTESRASWGAHCDDGQNITSEQLQTGALLRMADATEKMATNYTWLQAEKERYERYYKQEAEKNSKLRKRIAGLQGVITKLKKPAVAL